MKIVFLDVKTIGEDIDLSAYDELGEVVKYSFSSPEEVPARVTDADVIILNKVPVNEQTIGTAKNLKLVCVTATGTNNLDKEYLDSKGIAWRNVAGYSTETVAQHTFAMLLFLLEKLRYYDDYVKEERYVNDVSFTHFAEHFTEIHGKTWGIIGLGAIGRRVAEIARAFGAKVIYYSASGAPAQEGYEQVDFETLLTQSDIISVHAPLNEHTEGLINSKAFEKQSLKQIAQYFATKHGLKLVGNVSDLQKIEVERKTQEKQTDLAFLSRLAREYGIVFSVRGDQLVFMDTEELESQPVVMTIHKNELSRASFTDKTSQVFGGAVVATRNMKTNSVRRWKIEPSDQEGGKGTLSKDTWQGDVTVENETQAQAKAKGALKEKNKDKITGSITVAGNVKLVAGINIELTGIGKFSGKWHVVSSAHDLDNSSGYVTTATIRKIEV